MTAVAAKIGAIDTESPADCEGTVNEKESDLTSEERWNIVWAAVNIYYTFDATMGFGLASAGFGCGVLYRALVKSDCENKLWIISLVILLVRSLDICSGFFSIARNPVPTRRGFVCDIARNVIVCISLGTLAIVQITMSILLLMQDGDDCTTTAIIYIVAALFLISQAVSEITVWIVVIVLWFVAESQPVPGWTDNIIPRFIEERAKANRQKH